MVDHDRDDLEARIGYRFRDETLLQRAFTHASAADNSLDSNERLEFLGDAVLGIVACELIYNKYPDLREGEMTKIKSAVVSRQTCADIAEEIGLHLFLHLGKGMRSRRDLPRSLASAALESLVGAMYLEGGLDPARAFLVPHLEPIVERCHEGGHQENFKSVLQQHAQQSCETAPVYTVLDAKGPDHSKCFQVRVEIGDTRFEPCWGTSKKQAEQLAALAALKQLGVAYEDESGHVRIVNGDEEHDADS